MNTTAFVQYKPVHKQAENPALWITWSWQSRWRPDGYRHVSILDFGHLNKFDAHAPQILVAAIYEFNYLSFADITFYSLLNLVACPVVYCYFSILPGHKPTSILLNCSSSLNELAELVLHPFDQSLYLPRLYTVSISWLNLALQGLFYSPHIRCSHGCGNARNGERRKKPLPLMLKGIRPACADSFFDDSLISYKLTPKPGCYRFRYDFTDFLVLFELFMLHKRNCNRNPKHRKKPYDCAPSPAYGAKLVPKPRSWIKLVWADAPPVKFGECSITIRRGDYQTFAPLVLMCIV